MHHPRGDDLTGERVYLGLGANMGAREANLLRAARLIEARGLGADMRLSSLYETSPVDCAPMEDFVNAVLEVRPLHAPGDLLERLKELEADVGRDTGHNEPRVLDIDIISWGRRTVDSGSLTIPHPRYRSRLFVLVPLCEIRPDFVCPLTGTTVREMISSVTADQWLRRISSRVPIRAGKGVPTRAK